MLKYAVILLDKSAAAFCHADNPHRESSLMPLETLRKAIFWAMKENLNIQFVYPDGPLQTEYLEAIDSIDHVDIAHRADADVCVIDGVDNVPDNLPPDSNAVLRTTLEEALANRQSISRLAARIMHLSVVIKDIDRLSKEDEKRYASFLSEMSGDAEKCLETSKPFNVSLLTDRLQLKDMNNCNAGWESITIAPNGRFYICPAFYYADEADYVGDLDNGLEIRNAQLYRLDHAPICRICDAYQCRRCIWLNRKTTLEVNTPGREQCVTAHLERNASRNLLEIMRKKGDFRPGVEIEQIDYLDPFEKINR